jgi:hypothetical protein
LFRGYRVLVFLFRGEKVRSAFTTYGPTCFRHVTFFVAHDLFRKPVPTFRDHAPKKKARLAPGLKSGGRERSR